MTLNFTIRNDKSYCGMYLIAIAWMYVVLMMVLAEALSTQGTVLGAVITFVLYGLLPLGLVMYILGTPGRRRIRQAAENAGQPLSAGPTAEPPSMPPDRSGHAASDAVAAKREEG